MSMKTRTVFSGVSCAALFFAAPAYGQNQLDWGDLEGLTPAEIGELVLQGLDHGQIIQIEYRSGSMYPFGEHDLLLYQKAERVGDNGCHRLAWSATVLDELPVEDAYTQLILDRRRSSDQVSLSAGVPCLFADYTSLANSVSPDEGLLALSALEGFKSSARAYTCSDETRGNLCLTEERVRGQIRQLNAWMVQRAAQGGWVFWMGERGGIVTEVTLPSDTAEPARIERRIPAPF